MVFSALLSFPILNGWLQKATQNLSFCTFQETTINDDSPYSLFYYWSFFVLNIKFLICMIVFLFGSIVPSQTFAQNLSDSEIQKLFEGNTVAGRYTDGAPFSEFHHPDGHAYGHNRGVANTDACWIVQPGKVCYYYGPTERRLLFCFTVTKNGESYILTNAPPNTNQGRVNALARVDRDNPEKLGDNGKPWVCDGLVSHLPNASHRFARLK